MVRYGYGARYGAVAGLGGQRRNAARLSPRGGLRGTRREGFLLLRLPGCWFILGVCGRRARRWSGLLLR
jgi:hypothetical protein